MPPESLPPIFAAATALTWAFLVLGCLAVVGGLGGMIWGARRSRRAAVETIETIDPAEVESALHADAESSDEPDEPPSRSTQELRTDVDVIRIDIIDEATGSEPDDVVVDITDSATKLRRDENHTNHYDATSNAHHHHH